MVYEFPNMVLCALNGICILGEYYSLSNGISGLTGKKFFLKVSNSLIYSGQTLSKSWNEGGSVPSFQSPAADLGPATISKQAEICTGVSLFVSDVITLKLYFLLWPLPKS